MTSLYAVLEKAGEETLLVSQTALGSMWDMSTACGYSSLKELINENADYLLNDVSLNLQRLSQHPQVRTHVRGVAQITVPNHRSTKARLLIGHMFAYITCRMCFLFFIC